MQGLVQCLGQTLKGKRIRSQNLQNKKANQEKKSEKNNEQGTGLNEYIEPWFDKKNQYPRD